jgi:hypothetical protein
MVMHRSRRARPRPEVPEATEEHTALREGRCWSCGSIREHMGAYPRPAGERPRTIAPSSAILATLELWRSPATTKQRDGVGDARHADTFATG